MTTRRCFVQSMGALVALGALYPVTGLAQALESVRIINGFPPGGISDLLSRRIGERIAGTPYSRHAAVVENKTGASGRIANEFVKNASADGAVLLLTPLATMAMFPHMFRKLSYDPFRDFAPVSVAATSHHCMTVGPMVPVTVRTVSDYLAWAKDSSRNATYGSPGPGSSPHFLGALLSVNTGVALHHVPYRGAIPGLVDMMGGQIGAMFTTLGDHVVANHKSGKLRILATSGPARSPLTPDVANFAEQGFGYLTHEEYWSFFLPARTPAGVVALANAAINAAVRDKATMDSLSGFGLVPLGSTPAEVSRLLKVEFDRWEPLIKKIGFTADS